MAGLSGEWCDLAIATWNGRKWKDQILLLRDHGETIHGWQFRMDRAGLSDRTAYVGLLE